MIMYSGFENTLVSSLNEDFHYWKLKEFWITAASDLFDLPSLFTIEPIQCDEAPL